MKVASIVRRVFGRKVFKQFSNLESLMFEYGQWGTIKNWDSVDKEEQPIPWYSYPAIEYLSHLNFSKFKIFEYGCGNSTLWWAQRAQQVVAVEDDKIWWEKIKGEINTKFTNATCHLEQDIANYASKAPGGFDIYVVDGKFRDKCVEHILSLEEKGVMIIIDNSDWLYESIELVRQVSGWIQVDFHGFGPINNYTTTTTIFINPNRSKELTYLQPLKSMCGLIQQFNAN